MQPTVSIIIPCYNNEKHIGKCIESILSQSYCDFELLLINDGSVDNSLFVMQEYEKIDNRIKVFTHPNKGVSFTRNRGIEVAAGEYLMFIDGDDYVKADYIEKLVAAAEKGSWPICGMINVRKGVENENENFAKLLQRYPEKTISKENLLDVLKHSSLSSPCARIYSKEIIVNHKVVFPENVSYQEDLLFNLAYCQHIQEIRLLDYFGYFYIEHSESSTSRYHQNFNHVDKLYLDLSFLEKTKEDKEVISEFVFQTIMRQISNVLHPNSSKNSIEKLQEIKDIFQSEAYDYSSNFILKSKINMGLKLLLKLKSPFLIYHYYKIFH